MTTFDYWVFGIFGFMVVCSIFFPAPPPDEYDYDSQDIGW